VDADKDGRMRDLHEPGYLFSEGGIYCPLCGGRMARGSYFCGRCRHAGRFHLDPNDIRLTAREIHLPRGIVNPIFHRHSLKHSA